MFKRITWTFISLFSIALISSCTLQTVKYDQAQEEKFESNVGSTAPVLNQAKDVMFATINLGFAEDRIYSLLIKPDNTVLAAGSAESGYRRDYSIAQFMPEGQLNSMFGDNGVFKVDLGEEYDHSKKVLLQSDGKIVMIGYTQKLNTASDTYDFSAVRLLENGSLDKGFGTDGKVVIDIDGSALRHDYAVSGAIQRTGKIILAGYTYNGATSKYNIAMVRLNADGSLDSSFGAAGKAVSAPDATANYYGMDIALDDNDNIFVAGYKYSPYDFVLAKFNKDGLLDTTFGNSGYLVTPVGTSHDFATSIAIQPDGNIVAAGYSYYYVTSVGWTYNFSAIRCKSNGVLDTSFGSGGKAVVQFPVSPKVHEYGRDVAILEDGGIIIVGNIVESNLSDAAVIKLKSDGSVDSGFSNSGLFRKDIAGKNDILYAVAVNGHDVFAGGETLIDRNTDYLMINMDSDGLLNVNFGMKGVAVAEVGRGGNSRGMELVELQGGQFYIVGNNHSGTDSDMAVFKLNSDLTLDTGFGNGGSMLKGLVDGGEDYARGVVPFADGSVIIGGHFNQGYSSTSKADFALVKVTSSGVIDEMSGFGLDTPVATSPSQSPTDGIAISALNTVAEDWIGDLAPWGDDKLIAAGSIRNSSTTFYELVITRHIMSTGGLDTSFGSGGMFRLAISGVSHTSLSNIIVHDEKIIAVGTYVAASGTPQKNNAFIIRLNSDGTLDGTFGSGGIVTRDGGSQSIFFTDAVIIPNESDPSAYELMLSGRVLTGDVADRDYKSILAKYDKNGTPVSSFGSSGLKKIDRFPTSGHNNMIIKDGVIYSSGLTLGTKNNGMVMAFDTNGEFVESFGDKGVFTLAETSYSPHDDVFFALAVREDGNILVTGYSCNGFNDELLALVLTPEGKLATK